LETFERLRLAQQLFRKELEGDHAAELEVSDYEGQPFIDGGTAERFVLRMNSFPDKLRLS
jgi:hypothetical protein